MADAKSGELLTTLDKDGADEAEYYDVERDWRASMSSNNEDYTSARTLAGKHPITFRLVAIQRVSNPARAAAFEATQKRMKGETKSDSIVRSKEELRVQYGFHGTHAPNISKICTNGLLPVGHALNPSKATDAGYFGSPKHGIYLSRCADYVCKYSNSLDPLEIGDTVKIIMFRVMPGRSKHIPKLATGIMPTAGYDSHSSPSYLEWFIFDHTAALPVYVLTVKAIQDRRTAADDGVVSAVAKQIAQLQKEAEKTAELTASFAAAAPPATAAAAVTSTPVASAAAAAASVGGPKCKVHPSTDLNMYCKKCSNSICALCVISSAHKSHVDHVLPLSEYISTIKSELQSNLAAVSKKRESGVTTDGKRANQMSELIKSKSVVVSKQIDDLCDHLTAAIKRRRDELKTQLQTAAKAKVSVVQGIQAKVAANAQVIHAAMANGESALKAAEATAMIAASNELKALLLKGSDPVTSSFNAYDNEVYAIEMDSKLLSSTIAAAFKISPHPDAWAKADLGPLAGPKLSISGSSGATGTPGVKCIHLKFSSEHAGSRMTFPSSHRARAMVQCPSSEQRNYCVATSALSKSGPLKWKFYFSDVVESLIFGWFLFGIARPTYRGNTQSSFVGWYFGADRKLYKANAAESINTSASQSLVIPTGTPFVLEYHPSTAQLMLSYASSTIVQSVPAADNQSELYPVFELGPPATLTAMSE